MDIDSTFKKIRPVEAPPFLFTRIERRISEYAVSPRWRLSAIAGLAILIMLNIYVITHPIKKSNSIETIVTGMSLSTSNNLYDE